MKEKKFILCFLIFAFGMCGNGSSIEVNEPDVDNLKATEKLEETVQTDTNNNPDSASKEKQDAVSYTHLRAHETV